MEIQTSAGRAKLLAQLTAVLGSRRTSTAVVLALAAGGGAYAYYLQEGKRSRVQQQAER